MKFLDNSKKIVGDVILNLIGSFFITGISQLIIYPILSQRMGENNFGSLLTLIGISNVIGVVLGNSLNNIKLLNDDKYNDKGIHGDFKYLLKKSIIIAIVSMAIIVLIFNKQIEIFDSIILVFVTIFVIYRSYFNAYYRIKFQYSVILIQMIITGIGYLIGLIIFQIIRCWPIVFLTGEILCYIFGYYSTNYKFEKYNKTKFYNETKNQFIHLATSNLVVNLLLYADRLLINPILGASNVTIYYVASIVGKLFGIVLQPVSGVMLTYISKVRHINKKKLFIIIVFTVIFCGIIGYITIISITPIIINIFYKNILENALKYSNIANLSVVFMIMGSLIQPFTLKFSPIKWQTIIQSIYGIVYLISSIILMKLWGLFGFCIASAFTNFIRLVLFIAVGYIYSRKEV